MWVVRACRVCLALDVPFEPPDKHRLHSAYETVAGIPLSEDSGMPQSLCFECAHALRKCSAFRKKCLRANTLLKAIYDSHDQITEREIAKVDRGAALLASSLASKVLEPQAVDPFVYFVPTVVKVEAAGDGGHFESADKMTVKKEEAVAAGSSLLNAPDGRDSDDGSLKDEPLINYKQSKSESKMKTIKELKSKTTKEKTLKKTKTKNYKKTIEEKPKKIRKRQHYPQSHYEEFFTITTLTREQQLEEINRRQETDNYKNSPLKCTLCYRGFLEDAALKNHMLRHDPASGDYECDICRRRFRMLYMLNKHVAGNHSRRFTCKSCQHVCPDPCKARLHEKWHKGTCYQCPHCDDSFLKCTSYMSHLRLKHPSQYVCEVCGNAFVSQKGILLHKNLIHKQEEVALDGPHCAECDVRFASEEAFKRHLVSSAKHNTDDRLHGCDECWRTFDSHAELGAHLLAEHGRSAHVLRQQRPTAFASDTWPRKCQLCPVELQSKREYRLHFKRTHKDHNYTCEVCGRGFELNAHLVYHLRTHTGESPFHCPQCPKRFSFRSQLQMHERTHTGERPYPCKLCRKAFRQRAALTRHLLVHSGAKPHECKQCGKTFSQSNSLKLHVHTVHLKLPPPYPDKRGRKAPLTS